MNLVEQCHGTGELLSDGQPLARVGYRVSRFQGFAASGMPIPGLQRIEGTLDLAALADAAAWVGSDLTLKLDDGRSWRVTLADADGRVLAEGHGPKRGCSCC